MNTETNTVALTEFNPHNANDRGHLAWHLSEMLEEAGFAPVLDVKGKEVVYGRQTPHSKIRVLVYTTIEIHGATAAVRKCGKDAIRICAVYRSENGTERGIIKTTRVNRTGTLQGITERTLQRMREVWKQAAHAPKCEHCGSPKFISTKGNAVCAEVCWTKPGFQKAPEEKTEEVVDLPPSTDFPMGVGFETHPEGGFLVEGSKDDVLALQIDGWNIVEEMGSDLYRVTK